MAPLFPRAWIPLAVALPGLFWVIHIIFFCICTSLNPADPNVRAAKIKSSMVKMDRNIRKHVIGNQVGNESVFRLYLISTI